MEESSKRTRSLARTSLKRVGTPVPGRKRASYSFIHRYMEEMEMEEDEGWIRDLQGCGFARKEEEEEEEEEEDEFFEDFVLVEEIEYRDDAAAAAAAIVKVRVLMEEHDHQLASLVENKLVIQVPSPSPLSDVLPVLELEEE